MTRICFVTTTSITQKSFVLPIAQTLQSELGWDVTLVCAPDDAFAATIPSSISFHPIKMSRGVNFDATEATRNLSEYFCGESFDIVQYSTPNASLYASVAAKKVGVPQRIYGQWGIRYVGFSGLKRVLFKKLEKVVCSNSTHIFSVSPLNMQFAIDEGLCAITDISVIGNGGTIGVDLQQFPIEKKEAWRASYRERLGLQDQDWVFGFIGRFSRDKGCNELLTAIKECAEKDSRIKLLVVGPDEASTDVDAETLSACRDLGCVLFTGFVEKSEVAKYCAAFDALAHPTYREGFGMAIQEAGAMAIPAITTNVPGACEVMEDGVSCVLVPAKDSRALSEAMLQASRDEARMQKLGQAARERVERLYERSIMLRNQADAYRGMQ